MSSVVEFYSLAVIGDKQLCWAVESVMQNCVPSEEHSSQKVK
jgi:hypothetical protein